MPPDFLNSREDAILLWTLLIVGYVTHVLTDETELDYQELLAA